VLAREHATVRPEASRTIIVVDDSEICREIVKLLLEEVGFEIISIRDPRDLPDALRATQPALVLADVNMPGLPGTKLVELLRRDGLLKCPVVLHSDRAEAELVELTRECGATGFIRKTANRDKFRAAVASFLNENSVAS
jgi:FixJ family two-component response regulator